MSLVALCLATFAATYVLNITYITVFYHRGLAHGAVALKPWMVRFVAATGPWVTGLDPKGWALMHRLHHQYSDQPADPHTPHHGTGIPGVFLAQLRSYERVLVKLLKKDAALSAKVRDLPFDVSWIFARRLWFLPYVAQAAVAVALGALVGHWQVGACYFLGMMSHPVQGWLVNSFGHAVGYRNYNTSDQSRNNALVAYLVWGEGFQNNHHRYPGSARFSARVWEFDLGYSLVLACRAIGLLSVRQETLAPRWTQEQGALAVPAE